MVWERCVVGVEGKLPEESVPWINSTISASSVELSCSESASTVINSLFALNVDYKVSLVSVYLILQKFPFGFKPPIFALAWARVGCTLDTFDLPDLSGQGYGSVVVHRYAPLVTVHKNGGRPLWLVPFLSLCTVTGALRAIIKCHKYKINKYGHFGTDKCMVVCAILV